MTYEISETSVNGQKPFTESKSNICFEGIDGFHYACYRKLCSEMTKKQMVRAHYGNEPGMFWDIGMMAFGTSSSMAALSLNMEVT